MWNEGFLASACTGDSDDLDGSGNSNDLDTIDTPVNFCVKGDGE